MTRTPVHLDAPATEPPVQSLDVAVDAVVDTAVDTVSELAVPTGQAAIHAAPTRVALARSRNGQRAIGTALVAFGALFAVVRAGRTAAIDRAVSRMLQRRSASLAPLMRLVSWPGFPPQSRVLPAIIAAVLWRIGLRLEAVFQVIAWSTAIVATLLKAIARRPRPSQADAIEIVAAPLRDSSFPSGHVLTYVGVYGFLAHLVSAHVRAGRARQAGVAALVALVGLVGPSRVQQGHHWPSDVLGSYLVGLPMLALFVEGYRSAKAHLLRTRLERAA